MVFLDERSTERSENLVHLNPLAHRSHSGHYFSQSPVAWMKIKPSCTIFVLEKTKQFNYMILSL